jgi:hypothetical protein
MNQTSATDGVNAQQSALTVITRIKPGQVASLEKLLDQIGGSNIAGNDYIRFGAVSTLHFCCWVVVQDDPAFPPSLVFECNHDGPTAPHLDQLIEHGRRALVEIYNHCEGFSAAGLKEYLLAHSAPTSAFYIGCPGQSLSSIQNAIAVRKAIQNFLDRQEQELSQLTAVEVHRRARQFLASESPVKPQLSPRTLDQQRTRAWTSLVLLALAALPLIVLLLPVIAVLVIILRQHEKADAAAPLPPPLPIDPRLFQHEDVYTMNHLTTMVNVKPGPFRLRTLKLVLWLINLLAKTVFITGNLGGIPTIHFARWILMEDGRRLLFFSNYDGSWASYLGDFVDKANYGLTAVWSNTDRFPESKFLFFGGALHIEAFKAWSREHNLFAGVWYTAYPDETLWNLQKDVRLRDTVGRDLNEEEARQLLQLL